MQTSTAIVLVVVVVGLGVAGWLLYRTASGDSGTSKPSQSPGARLGRALGETGEAISSIEELFS